jgi:membrane protease YdiL (CAAX protease family)
MTKTNSSALHKTFWEKMVRGRSISKCEWLLIIGIFIAISLAEYIFVYGDVRIGIVLALFIVIGIYSVISIKEMSVQVVDSAECLALVPLYILLTASLPWFFLNQAYILPAVYAVIIGLCFYYVYDNDLGFGELGFKKEKFLKYALLGIVIGVPFGAIEYIILTPAPAFPTFTFEHLFTDFVFMLFFVALGEELLFRALIQRNLSRAFGTTIGLVSASFMFAVMHLMWRSTPELFFVFFGGMVLGYLYQKTGSLTAPIAVHAVGNTMLVGVCPYILQ